MEFLFEIIFQILGWVFGAVLEVLAEVVLGVVIEAIGELLGHLLRPLIPRRDRPLHPLIVQGFHVACGALAGALSLQIVPTLFIEASWLRVANLIVTPVLAGFAMERMGTWRRSRGQQPVQLDTFLNGALFAFAMAMVRLGWGQ